MTTSTCNDGLVEATRKACSFLGRPLPEVVVAVFSRGKDGYLLRLSPFPVIDIAGECRAPVGGVAAGVASLVGARNALVFLYGMNPVENNQPEHWWSLLNPILEAEDPAGGGRVTFVPLITN